MTEVTLNVGEKLQHMEEERARIVEMLKAETPGTKDYVSLSNDLDATDKAITNLTRLRMEITEREAKLRREEDEHKATMDYKNNNHLGKNLLKNLCNVSGDTIIKVLGYSALTLFCLAWEDEKVVRHKNSWMMKNNLPK